jgi:hypothetical protein
VVEPTTSAIGANAGNRRTTAVGNQTSKERDCASVNHVRVGRIALRGQKVPVLASTVPNPVMSGTAPAAIAAGVS